VTARVDVALVHYPVYNKEGAVVASAITNLDLHDIARAAKTFGVDTFHVVTPVTDQQQLFTEILDHWLHGAGAAYNEKRKEALTLVRLCDSIATLRATVRQKWGEVCVLATTAGERNDPIPYGAVRQRIAAGQPLLILFGTGWGLAEEAAAAADGFLPPIRGKGDYNHLSVRAAVAIILDRLLGEREGTGR